MGCCDDKATGPETPAGDVSLQNVGGFVELYVVGTGPNPFKIRTLRSSDGSIEIVQNGDHVDLKTEGGTPPTMKNVGNGARIYVVGTGPNPFQLRTLTSQDGSVAISENTSEIDLTVTHPPHDIRNIGGAAKVYKESTSLPWDLRTLYSSDGSVTVTEESQRINFQVVSGGGSVDVFQNDEHFKASTNSTTFQLLGTIAGSPKVLAGQTWKINTCLQVCHPQNVWTVNTEVHWLIEGPTNTWTQLIESWQTNVGLTIVQGGSVPYHRTTRVVPTINSPRVRVYFRMTAAQAASTFVEYPRWGGVRID